MQIKVITNFIAFNQHTRKKKFLSANKNRKSLNKKQISLLCRLITKIILILREKIFMAIKIFNIKY